MSSSGNYYHIFVSIKVISFFVVPLFISNFRSNAAFFYFSVVTMIILFLVVINVILFFRGNHGYIDFGGNRIYFTFSW